MIPGGGQKIRYVCLCESLCFPKRLIISFFSTAYTNDVVLAIKKSQMLICVLSDDYFTNSNAVFELESGVQVGLHPHKADLCLVLYSFCSNQTRCTVTCMTG